LYHIDSLRACPLHNNRLLRVRAQSSRGISLGAKALDGIGNRGLICRHGLANRCIVVDIVRHHLQDVRKMHQSNESRIKSLLLRGIAERIAGKPRIVGEPIIDVENFLRVRGGGCNLREQ
jgi:hypothetical protein